jgi:hypothetical protein
LNIKRRSFWLRARSWIKIPALLFLLYGIIVRYTYAYQSALDVVTTLNGIQQLLMQIGPILSAVLFITAGIFYALGQLFPSYKRANLHTMAIDLIIGAIVVAVLSVASGNLALASTHLLSNVTSNTL